MSFQLLLDDLRSLGAKPPHVNLILRAWLAGRDLLFHSNTREYPYPRTLLDALPEIERRLRAVVVPASEHAGADGSSRFLLQLHDGRTIESMLLLNDGVCVSTQVGCAVGCVFCMTGRGGLVRQVSSLEILAQVVLARSRRPVRRVVLMGMGEPAHNLPEVLEALHVLGHEGQLNHKNLVFSTVGEPRLFDRLAQCVVKPALALSLHTTDAKLRTELLPRAPKMAPEELIEQANRYAERTTYPIQYQWTLLEGINDSDRELERLVELLHGHRAVVNFIPYNTIEGVPYRRPSVDRAREMVRHLHSRGVLAKLRQSAGQDVDGGCGQLRARTLATS